MHPGSPKISVVLTIIPAHRKYNPGTVSADPALKKRKVVQYGIVAEQEEMSNLIFEQAVSDLLSSGW
jgi:hypothetical protein